MLAISVAVTIIGRLLSPHPVGPQPSALGDFSVPTANEGRAIPVVLGTCMVKGGNTVWWGDLKSTPIKAGGGIMALGMTTITGYNYFLGCQFMLCHGSPDLELVGIQADGKDVPYTSEVVENGNGSENYLALQVNAVNLFGGTKAPGGGGGLSGKINFYRGLTTQQPDAYLSAKQGRIVLDQSGIGYEFSGIGNGTIEEESGGSSAVDETITITAIGIDGNNTHGTYQKMKFSVIGSSSGALENAAPNSDGSRGCWADQAFSCPEINFTITTGSTQFSDGDRFTIATQHSQVASAYRGKCYAVFCQLYVGSSNYLKPLAFIVRRCPDPLGQGSGIASIAGDANGALAVYELLTNADYGLGLPAVTIDAASFAAAAVTLAGEGLGISMQIDSQGTADQLIGEILRHVDGVIYTDPSTGLWTIVLARGGYDPSTLPELTVDNVLETVDFSRGSWSETTNRVAIKYSSRAGNFCDALLNAYDPANIAVTGEVRPEVVEFKGISNATAAALIAIRVLKVFTYPLSKIKLIANRSAWAFRPAGLFRLTWAPLGIVNQVFRITKLGYGSLTDGKITIDAVEDIFGINSVAFVPPPASGWVNPNGAPAAPSHQRLVELPYQILESLGATAGIYELALCVRGDQVSKWFEIWLGSTPALSVPDASFVPGGVLADAYPAATSALDTAGFTVGAGIDLDALVQGQATDLAAGTFLALIDDELLAYQGYVDNGDGTLTIKPVIRGVFDTVPADHAANAPVYFFDASAPTTKSSPEANDLTVTADLLPENSAGCFAIGSATPVTLTTRSRFARPYPPGNLTICGAANGVIPATVAGDLTFAWSSRNRLTQTAAGGVVRQDASDIPGESGQSFRVEILVGGVLAHSFVADGQTYNYTAGQRIIDDADLTKTVTIRIFSTVDTLDSYFPMQFSTVMTCVSGTSGGLLAPGRHEFNTTSPAGAGSHPGGSGTATVTDPQNAIDGDDGTYADLNAQALTSFGGDVATMVVSGFSGSSPNTSVLNVDYEVVQNDLVNAGQTLPAWQIFISQGMAQNPMVSAAPGAGPVARTIATYDIVGGWDLSDVTATIGAICAPGGGTNGVRVRVYAVYITTT